MRPRGPTLQTAAVKWVNQHINYCHHRSAASASVRDNGTLDLYCHERAADNGFLSGPGDDWEFREGLNYDNCEVFSHFTCSGWVVRQVPTQK